MPRMMLAGVLLLSLDAHCFGQTPTQEDSSISELADTQKKVRQDYSEKLTEVESYLPYFLLGFVAFAGLMAGTILLNRRGSVLLSEQKSRHPDEDEDTTVVPDPEWDLSWMTWRKTKRKGFWR